MTEENLTTAIGLQALLEQDMSSYEYFNSLSDDLKRQIEERDFCSFGEMQNFVRSRTQHGR